MQVSRPVNTTREESTKNKRITGKLGKLNLKNKRESSLSQKKNLSFFIAKDKTFPQKIKLQGKTGETKLI